MRRREPELPASNDHSVAEIGEILERKSSVARMMSKTADNLAHSFEFHPQQPTPEEMVFDLFKLPNQQEASIGKLITVLRSFGLREDDARLRVMMERVRELDMAQTEDGDVRHFTLSRKQFTEWVKEGRLGRQ